MMQRGDVAMIIPAIDILDGKVVRLYQGDYDQVKVYDESPGEMARYFEASGVKRIHLVDLNGAKAGKLVNRQAICEIRESCGCVLELGGGIRDQETVRQLFDLGIDVVILGSLLIKDWDLACEIVSAFPHKVMAGLDAKDGYIATEGWLDVSALHVLELVETIKDWPLAGLIYTDIATDGTLSGPNIEGVEAVLRATRIPVVASGGVGTLAHIRALQDIAGLFGIIVGKAFLSRKISLKDVFND